MPKDFEHYFSERPKCELEYRIIRTLILGKLFEFITCKGVFSYKKIDLGSRVLLNAAEINRNSFVLDLGCGYGVIGIVIAKIYNSKVIMIDINKRAIKLAKENVIRNNVQHLVEVRRGYLYEPVKGEKFDVIVTNPPLAAGKKVIFEIIENARNYLKKNGSLQIVVRKGKELIKRKLEDTFGNVETLSKSSGYRVYKSTLY